MSRVDGVADLCLVVATFVPRLKPVGHLVRIECALGELVAQFLLTLVSRPFVVHLMRFCVQLRHPAEAKFSWDTRDEFVAGLAQDFRGDTAISMDLTPRTT